MSGQTPQQLANEACRLLLLCEGGLGVEDQLPAWADDWIMRLPQLQIPAPLFYLSTSMGKSPPDIWSALRELGERHQAEVVSLDFLKTLLAHLNQGITSPGFIAHALARADHSVEHPGDWPNFEADFMAMDHAPITETEIATKMRAWLSTQTREQPDAAGTP